MRGSTNRRPKAAGRDRPARRGVARARGPRPSNATLAPDARVVDLARVVEARRRIASGWYDRADVRDSLVEAVLQEMRSR
jgi:hypothetical protein